MAFFAHAESRGSLVRARVENLDNGGMALVIGSGKRIFLPWPLLGLTEAPENSSRDKMVLRWRLHCVDPESRTTEFFAGDMNRCILSATESRSTASQRVSLRTGVLNVDLHVERFAILNLVVEPASRDLPLRLSLADSLSVCLEHRQPWDKGACCLCGQGLSCMLRQRAPPDLFQSTVSYARRWGAMVELESAASVIESNDSRFFCNVYVNWEPKQRGSRQRGSFSISVALSRAHKLKFRGLLSQGGESAAGWLCMREDLSHGEQRAPWSAHACVVAAGILGEGAELGLDDEDNLKKVDGRRSITVVFEVLDEFSDPGTPSGDWFLVEYLQKALSHSMQHTALAEVNPAPKKDGAEPKPLLARDVVLNRLPPTTAIDPANNDQWRLNPSQDQAIRRALARPLMLVHGPPGTGKTRTAAILMTLLAQRNLGARCAMLFAAPTNKACDAALHNTNSLCKSYFSERLRARVEEDGDADCAICLEGAPDIVTACGHVFHRECAARALQESSKCPMCRQVLKQHGGGLRILRVYGADTEREDFPVPRRIDHKGVQTFKTQTVPREMRRFTLHWRCHAAVEDEEPSAEAVKTRRAYERLRSTNPKSNEFDEFRSEYYEALTKARAIEVHQSDIIFTTCVSARRMALVAALEAEGAPEIRQVILDEAGQAPEPEALCPLAVARRAKQAVFFGDHKQLRPILKSKLAEQAGLGISLFERLATQNWLGYAEPPVSLLAQQYRMHPAISSFPRQQFYSGKVLDDDSVLARAPGLLSHPDSGKHTAFLLWDSASCNSDCQEQLQRVRTVGAGGVGSRSNFQEASRAAALARALAREAGEKSVAVLSWYNSQVAKVSEMMRKSGMNGVHVGSIATAQGSEWDYVILSAVRSGTGNTSLGLVADPHNLNVALTRAKLGLVVLCDTGAMRRNPHWHALISKCGADGLLVDEQPVVRANPIPPPPREPPAPRFISRPVPPPPPPPVPAVRAEVANSTPSTGMDRRSIEMQMELAALQTLQRLSQVQICRCNGGPNVLQSGSCNACGPQIAYSGHSSGVDGSNFLGQQLSIPMPVSLLNPNALEFVPKQVSAALNHASSDQSTRGQPGLAHPRSQPNHAFDASARFQNSVAEIVISDTSQSSNDGQKRRRRSPSDSRKRSRREPKRHDTKKSKRRYRRRSSSFSDAQSSDDSRQPLARRRSNPSSGSARESRSDVRDSRSAWGGTMSAASSEDPLVQRGPRNALFGQRPPRAKFSKAFSHEHDDRSIGG